MSLETSVAVRHLERGDIIAERYKIDREIGTGGMAVVYLAEDLEEGGRPVALKILHREFMEDKSYVERFIREGRMLRKVTSPNVVEIYDIGTDHGVIYLAMEFVPCRSLEEIMCDDELDEIETARLILGVCRGLCSIHDCDIVHRDLKPGNILVSRDGTVRLADFGVARDATLPRLTEENQKVGSVAYIAPEVWLGSELTPSVDLYGLGVVLYELITGNLPFEHDWPGEVMQMHIKQAPAPPKKRNASVPEWLNELTLRLLEKKPEDRLGSAREVIEYVILRVPLAAKQSTRVIEREELQLPDQKGFQSSRRAGEANANKTYVFRLTSTQVIEDASKEREDSVDRPDKFITINNRKATVCIPLPRKAAVVVEIDPPSREFLFLGVFLASLQIFDGVLTALGMREFGLQQEGNPLLRRLMETYGVDNTLLIVKAFTIYIVACLTVAARRSKWITDLIGFLSCLYLFAAILPWLYLLFVFER